MSVVGIDFGNYKSVIAVARNRGIDIVTNEVSNRFTPSMVGFTGNQRLLGEAAKTQEVMNLRNTITDIRRMLGRSLAEEDVEAFERPHLLYDVVATEDGSCGAKVNYGDDEKTFTMTQLAGMYMTDMKKIAEAALQTPVHDCVISVPAYYTDRQRHALIAAAEIAGLNPLRLLSEPAAAALVYGITRVRELPEKDKDPRHVVFVDIGQSATTVSVVAFTQEKATVKATVFDRNLGGRNVDMELVKHFAQEILTKHKVDVKTKPKAMLRLRSACERVKKVLSANSVAAFTVENLTDDIDVRSQLTREDMDAMIKHLVERLDIPLRLALHAADVRKDSVEFVELIGGSTRVPSFKARVAEFFGNREGLLSTTLNQDEAVARGCAFQCAMISPLFKVRDYALKDINSYDIKVAWKTDADESINETLVFKEFDPIPSTKALTSYRTGPFEVTAHYANAAQLPKGTPAHIAKFRVKDVKPGKDGKPSEVKLKMRVNPNGILTVESAQQIEELEPEPTSDAAADADAAKAQATPPAAPAAGASDATAETNAEAAAAAEEKKRKVKRIDLAVESTTSALPASLLQTYREAEAAMVSNDKLIADTLEKKNQLEEFVYDIRGKLDGIYSDFIDPAVKAPYLEKLTTIESWLYDEGETATKSAFVERLVDLQKVSQPVVDRFNESEARPKAIAELELTLQQIRDAAQSWEEKYAHIEPADKAKVVDEVIKKESWLANQKQAQSQLKGYQTPAFKSTQVTAERASLLSFANAILNKPKPAAPPPAATATPPPQPAPAPNAAAADDASTKKDETPAAPPADGQMDLD